MIDKAACLPSSTATTVRSRPPAAQSPPAQTPGRVVRRSKSTAMRPPSSSRTSCEPVENLRNENLPDRPEQLIRRQFEGFPRIDEPAVLHSRRGEADGPESAVRGMDRDRARPMADHDAVDQREFLLVAARTHLLAAAAIDDGHFLGAELFSLHCRVDGRHAAADHDDAAADGEGREIPRLPQCLDERNGILDAIQVIAFGTQSIHRLKSEPEKHRVEIPAKIGQRKIASEHLPAAQLDSSDAEDPVHLGLGEVVRRLVGGDPVLVEASRLRPPVEHHHVIPERRQPVGAGEPGGPRADHRDALPGARALPIELPSRGHDGIGRVALQLSDDHRLAFRSVADAGLLAEGLRGTDPGAHAAEDIRVQDRLAGSLGISGGDLSNEEGDVDARRAGIDAGRIVAEQAALSCDPSFMRVQGRMKVGKSFVIRAGCKPSGANIGC